MQTCISLCTSLRVLNDNCSWHLLVPIPLGMDARQWLCLSFKVLISFSVFIGMEPAHSSNIASKFRQISAALHVACNLVFPRSSLCLKQFFNCRLNLIRSFFDTFLFKSDLWTLFKECQRSSLTRVFSPNTSWRIPRQWQQLSKQEDLKVKTY